MTGGGVCTQRRRWRPAGATGRTGGTGLTGQTGRTGATVRRRVATE